MPRVTKARAVGFVPSGSDKGMPIFKEFSDPTCVDDGLLPGVFGNRKVGFTEEGIPLFAQALTCCDIVDDCQRVEEFDWFPEGITQTILLKSFEVENCTSAKGNTATLTYCAAFDADGPRFGSTAISTGAGGAWANPTNVFANDGTYAVASPGGTQTATLRITGFSFNIPTSVTILGIKAKIRRKVADANNGDNTTADLLVQLRKSSGAVGNNKAFTTRAWPSSEYPAFYGDSSDLWGTTWTPSEVNHTDFGIDIRAQSIGVLLQNNDAMIDSVEITIYHTFEVGYTTEECEWEECNDTPNPLDPCDICEYVDTGRGKWEGSLVLGGGTLNFILCLTDLGDFYSDPQLPPTFTLIYRGCDEGCVSDGQAIQCFDPLSVGGVASWQLDLSDCCDCDTDFTDTTATLLLGAQGNCYPVVLARQIGFTPAGKPLFAADNCGGDTEQECCAPKCGLAFSITNITGCECMTSTGTLSYESASDAWFGAIGGTCPGGVRDITVACSAELDENDNPTGRAIVGVLVVCGVITSGGDTAFVDCDDMDELDVTFTISLDGSTGVDCSTGNCNYIYNAMAAGWQFTNDTCPHDDCDECPNSPINPPPSPVDQQPFSEPCTGGQAVECCIGSFAIRVTRL